VMLPPALRTRGPPVRMKAELPVAVAPLKVIPATFRPESTVIVAVPVFAVVKVATSVLVVLPLAPPGTPAPQVESVQFPVVAVPVQVELAA